MSWDLYVTCSHCGRGGGGFNYTHNTNPMMSAAGCDPGAFDGLRAFEAMPKLRALLAELEAHPDKYRAMDPENGWGSYDSLLPVLREIETAVAEAPSDSLVSVSM